MQKYLIKQPNIAAINVTRKKQECYVIERMMTAALLIGPTYKVGIGSCQKYL